MGDREMQVHFLSEILFKWLFVKLKTEQRKILKKTLCEVGLVA
jgi:hypothetical protein